jgi:hypothetical protein
MTDTCREGIAAAGGVNLLVTHAHAAHPAIRAAPYRPTI